MVRLDDRDLHARQGAANMAVDNEREAWIQEIDAALQKWCQGDYVLGEQWFIQRFNPKRPLTDESKDVAEKEVDLAEYEVRGFVVVTQTCDIVRSCASRQFIEVVPLREVNEKYLHDIQRGRRPQYAYIPGAAEHRLVADLDRVMTVEKAVVAEWERKAGCSDDGEVRALGKALARKRIRFAFPDDFTELARNLLDRLQDKHDKASIEGEALRALREIRVRAAPCWNDPEIELMFWFIRHEEQIQFQGTGWEQQLTKWLALIPESGRFQSIEGLVVTLEDMTAKEYVESDPLDLDHLSR
jgi:hypothetical protein